MVSLARPQVVPQVQVLGPVARSSRLTKTSRGQLPPPRVLSSASSCRLHTQPTKRASRWSRTASLVVRSQESTSDSECAPCEDGSAATAPLPPLPTTITTTTGGQLRSVRLVDETGQRCSLGDVAASKAVVVFLRHMG
mmetsp:Transcript_5566/g.6407  ORF Transcript_5566/g.6407 Transcript_5566/m.6407 type:complete len:138 (+) Transcript_5566:137-550(+)